MASSCECRICLCTVQSCHSTALFSASSLHLDWPQRIHKLLDVDVLSEPGLPSHICKMCKGKFVSLEEKLRKMQILAQESMMKLKERQTGSGGRKRTKDTSGEVGVSPHTQRVRPQAKRSPVLPTPRRILFSDPSAGLLPTVKIRLRSSYMLYNLKLRDTSDLLLYHACIPGSEAQPETSSDSGIESSAQAASIGAVQSVSPCTDSDIEGSAQAASIGAVQSAIVTAPLPLMELDENQMLSQTGKN